MDIFDIKEALNTFRVIVDNREQKTPKAAGRYAAFGTYERATLDYGDYCGNIILPDGKPLYDCEKRLTPSCVVERKMSLDELAQCFTRGRERFQREFERARNNRAKVYLLVEGGSWEAINNHRYKSRLNPTAFRASLIAFMVRYDADVVFCKADTSGSLIREILFRDIKEKLNNGDFDYYEREVET